eukprot:GFYU01011748.1.p1 GENE.GFYU01011748.1~~GFYU01011748.1.p1  ORF type:complete len:246 (+),score=47.42 GFYU01011748.1:64-801(+)
MVWLQNLTTTTASAVACQAISYGSLALTRRFLPHFFNTLDEKTKMEWAQSWVSTAHALVSTEQAYRVLTSESVLADFVNGWDDILVKQLYLQLGYYVQDTYMDYKIGFGRIGWSFLFHHAITGLGLSIPLWIRKGGIVVGFLMLTNVTSILKNTIWKMERLGKTNTALFKLVGILFVIGFFIFRVGLFWYAIELFGRTRNTDFFGALSQMPVQCITYHSLFAGLNIYWFILILAKVRRKISVKQE